VKRFFDVNPNPKPHRSRASQSCGVAFVRFSLGFAWLRHMIRAKSPSWIAVFLRPASLRSHAEGEAPTLPLALTTWGPTAVVKGKAPRKWMTMTESEQQESVDAHLEWTEGLTRREVRVCEWERENGASVDWLDPAMWDLLVPVAFRC
jgi:hypothetical protein